MRIIDLDESNLQLYFVCLEDWSDEMKEAGNLKETWYKRMKYRGLRVKLAVDEEGTVGGMIQYVPIEQSFVDGSDLYFINCIWVHGYKQGRGDFRKHGMGTALLEAAEADARAVGAKGMAAWGILIPVFMRASWFRKHGFRTADRKGTQALMWKPFAADALPPKWIRGKYKPEIVRNKVTVTAFCSGWCPGQNLTFQRAKRAAAEPGFEGKVEFRAFDTFDREDVRRHGISGSLFSDRKRVWSGPPPSYEKICRLISKRVKRLG